MFSLIADITAWITRFFIRPGDDVSSVPSAAPRMTTNSEGWSSTGKWPPAIAKPPAMAPSTMRIPGSDISLYRFGRYRLRLRCKAAHAAGCGAVKNDGGAGRRRGERERIRGPRVGIRSARRVSHGASTPDQPHDSRPRQPVYRERGPRGVRRPLRDRARRNVDDLS